MCAPVCLRACAHVCEGARVCVCDCACLCPCMCARVCGYVRECVRRLVCTRVFEDVCVCTCVWLSGTCSEARGHELKIQISKRFGNALDIAKLLVVQTLFCTSTSYAQENNVVVLRMLKNESPWIQ